MARTPDVRKFEKWFRSRNDELIGVLVEDFREGRLAKTRLLKAYRATSRLVPDENIPVTEVSKPSLPIKSLRTYYQSKFGSQDAIIEPVDMETVIDQIENDGLVQAVVMIALSDVIDCKDDIELKERLAELLTGTATFKDIDDAIDYDFIGGDASGLYFDVKCLSLPFDRKTMFSD